MLLDVFYFSRYHFVVDFFDSNSELRYISIRSARSENARDRQLYLKYLGMREMDNRRVLSDQCHSS
jgi:hypothetical protein